MTEDTENLVLGILKDIQGRLSRIEHELTSIRVEMGAMGQQLAGLTTAFYAGRDRMNDFEQRLTRIERRLELRDTD
jgi:hypothetical protein